MERLASVLLVLVFLGLVAWFVTWNTNFLLASAVAFGLYYLSRR